MENKDHNRLSKENLSLTFPQLLEEWDYEKNSELGVYPNKVLPGSGIRVFWICSNNTEHKWMAFIRCRTKRKSDCPFCRNEKRSLFNHSPHLLSEWDYERNKINPKNISFGSPAKAWWRCSKNVEHCWESKICLRTSVISRGCPYCRGIKVNHTNSFGNIRKDLLKEWNWERNHINPHSISVACAKKVWWKCEKEHIWKTSINNRTTKNSGCPFCCRSRSFSLKEKEVLECLKRDFPNDIIEENKKNLFENRKLEIDIWFPEKKIGIEFNGTYWHSFEDALKRDEEKRILCKENGYTLFYILEEDWKEDKNQSFEKLKKDIEICKKG